MACNKFDSSMNGITLLESSRAIASRVCHPVGTSGSKRAWDGDGVPVKDSNMALVGSQTDKDAWKAAAKHEPAWEKAGDEVGILVWRIEQFKVAKWPEKEYGNFYEGDSYIILHTTQVSDHTKLIHHIYFWLGESTTTDEMGTAAYKTAELDCLLDGEPTQTREVMHYESAQFKTLFPVIHYQKGGIESGFNSIGVEAYESRLYEVRKVGRANPSMHPVVLSRDSLNHEDCFILDTGKIVYVFEGNDASADEKFAAQKAALHLAGKRGGHAVVNYEADANFWEKIGGEGEIAPKRQERPPTLDVGVGTLYALSHAVEDDTLKMAEVARGDQISPSDLDSGAVMLLNLGNEICIWIGRDADQCEQANAYPTAMNFLKANDMSPKTPIQIFKQDTTIMHEDWLKVFTAGKVHRTKTRGTAPLSMAQKATPSEVKQVEYKRGFFMPLKQLVDAKVWQEAGVDPAHREQYLCDADFSECFGMIKAEFAALPKWKALELKKQHKLF